MKSNSREIAVDRGRRLKIAYSLTGLNAVKFCSQSNFKYHILKAWEKGIVLLKDEEAVTICWILKKQNILCTKDWLLHGIGSYPSLVSQYNFNQINSEVHCHKLISFEKEEFLNNTSNSFIYTVENCELAPFYNIGDYIGCINILLPHEELNLISNCLIKFKNSNFIRFEKICYVDDYIVILPKNNSPCNILTATTDFELLAKIVWHRRPINFDV